MQKIINFPIFYFKKLQLIDLYRINRAIPGGTLFAIVMIQTLEIIMTSRETRITTSFQAPIFSNHAETRMQQRGIKYDDIRMALDYGREIRAKGLVFYVIGHKEITRYGPLGINLSDLDGLQVLVSACGAVVTTYRSQDLHAIRVTQRSRDRHRYSH